MKELSITNLAKILNARIIGSPGAGQTFSSVNTDSRNIKAGDCFFAIAGENFDGHNYLADVFAKGASSAVVSQDIPPDQFTGKAILKVSDTIKALGELAAWYRKDSNFKVVAITGSAGKTTTRQIVHSVLSKRFKTHQPTKNFNNFIGLPLSILAAPPDTQILILELATNHPGEIEYLSRIAAPDIALVTNVHPAHLAGFGSIENIAKEKLSISKGLSPQGILIINADCPPLIDFARKSNLSFETFFLSQFRLFSPQACPGGFSDDLFVGPLSSRFNINGITVEIPLPGWGNLENALAAWAICSELGISARDFADVVKTITPVSMRCEILNIGGPATAKRSEDGLTVISDCYNANPASMQNALDILSRLGASHGEAQDGRACHGEAQRRRVFICGDMAELGIDAEKYHAELGRLIAGYNVSLLLTAGPLAALAADAAKQARPDLQTACFAQTAELCNNLHQFIKVSDIILIKGSRINKLEIVIEKLKKLINLSA